MPNEPLFAATALESLTIPGAALRWQAVQHHLHPPLAALAEQVAARAATDLPRLWWRYETSYKTQRYINRGQGIRSPIDDYFVAFDRPPRGGGVLVSVSGSERAVLVGLQLWGKRKPALRDVWQTAPTLWQPLVARIGREGMVRFAGAPADSVGDDGTAWLTQYLTQRQAHYLWAGFVYPWDTFPPDLAARLIADVLALLPLNDAVMDCAEQHAPAGAVLLREQHASYTVATEAPPIAQLEQRIAARRFVVGGTLVRAYHVAVQHRPLVILSGISGTGKTRLTRLYADAYHTISDGAANPYYLLVAVQPDWHSPRDLLGYYNALTGQYQPTTFLRFLLQAAADPLNLYFVCLDEMNLARPEYYLAPLLSALESGDQTLDLGMPAASVPTVTGEMLPNLLRLPINVRIIGTVNVDESTFPLSDKLLDRANVIELTTVDLEGFRASYPLPIDDGVWQLLTALHAAMSAAGYPFGYRTLQAIVGYIEQSVGVLSVAEALDVQVKQAVLPRLRGADSPRLRTAFQTLQVLLAAYPASAAKLQQMQDRLDTDGYTDFYS